MFSDHEVYHGMAMTTDEFNGHDASWIRAARPAGAFLCDAFFSVADSVYVGPENGMTPAQWETARVPLPPPGLPLHPPGRVSTAALAGREEALAAHAEAVMRAARAHGRTAVLVRPFPLFAVRPAILGGGEGGGEALAEWPWSDTLPEALGVLEALAGAGAAAPGTTILDEVEQGWRIRAVAAPGSLLLVEWDGEGPPPAGEGWRLDAARLTAQAAAARDRLRRSHARLRRLLGRDLWS